MAPAGGKSVIRGVSEKGFPAFHTRLFLDNPETSRTPSKFDQGTFVHFSIGIRT